MTEFAPKPQTERIEKLSRKILLADDKDFVRMPIAFFLEDEGYEVVHAEDGEDILKMLPGGSFDAVISDNNMLKLDGIEALRRIRQDPEFEEYKNIPFFLITGLPDPQFEEEVKVKLKAGYFTKPFHMEDLTNALKVAIENPDE